jgi:hypothetical protein
MNTRGFLQGNFSLPARSFTAQQPSEAEDREIIQVCIVGSLQGIYTTILSLHQRGFAEVNDWCRPQPTGKPGEYISVLLKQIANR